MPVVSPLDTQSGALTCRVLGARAVTGGDRPVKVPPGRLSVLLASLLLRPNQLVPARDLIDRLWDDDPPPTSTNTLQVYIARLRRALGPGGPAIISTRAGGDLAHASSDTLDLLRFTDLLDHADRARASGDSTLEARLTGEAVALWQRPILTNVPSDLLHRDAISQLEERWAYAVERRIEVDLG